MLNRRFEKIISIPKSLYFCLKSLPIKDAIRIPVLISWRTKLKSVKGIVAFTTPPQFAMVRIGFGGAGTAEHIPCSIENNGTLILGEHVNFGGGCQICTVNSQSILEVGMCTSFMGEDHVVAKKHISIGEDCLISWAVQVIDTDLHDIFSEGVLINPDKEIFIGNHVWLCSNVSVLKGSIIPNNNIIASGALICGKIEKEFSVLTGSPLVLRQVDFYIKNL